MVQERFAADIAVGIVGAKGNFTALFLDAAMQAFLRKGA